DDSAVARGDHAITDHPKATAGVVQCHQVGVVPECVAAHVHSSRQFVYTITTENGECPVTPDNASKSVHFHAAHALLPDGWAQDVRIESMDGRITAVMAGTARKTGDQALGTVVAGLGNLHSHAFQRAMA